MPGLVTGLDDDALVRSPKRALAGKPRDREILKGLLEEAISRGFNAVYSDAKSELIWPVAWQTRSQAENALARYIDGFYNPVRRPSTLGYQSPVQFEMAARE